MSRMAYNKSAQSLHKTEKERVDFRRPLGKTASASKVKANVKPAGAGVPKKIEEKAESEDEYTEEYSEIDEFEEEEKGDERREDVM